MVMGREQVHQAAGGDLRHGPHLPDRHLQRDGAAHLRPWVPRHLLEERFRCDGAERKTPRLSLASGLHSSQDGSNDRVDAGPEGDLAHAGLAFPERVSDAPGLTTLAASRTHERRHTQGLLEAGADRCIPRRRAQGEDVAAGPLRRLEPDLAQDGLLPWPPLLALHAPQLRRP